jgi:hypothetical protein
MELRREEVLATSRRSHARAVRCVVCGRVVRPGHLVGVEPARAPRDRVLPCHRDCAGRVGRRVLATDPDPRSLRQPIAVGARPVAAPSVSPRWA